MLFPHWLRTLPVRGTSGIRHRARRTQSVARQVSIAHAVEPLESRRLLTNDPLFSAQTELQRIGATAAWDVRTGSNPLVVAVIDSGIDYTSPDLYQNIWLNQGEIPASLRPSLRDPDGDGLITFRDLNQTVNAGLAVDRNHTGYIDAGDLLSDPVWRDGIDGDLNGKKDDLIGWDFTDNDLNPFDENGHGTHVSGILAAAGNNATGIAGVNWSAQIMVVKFLDGRLHGDVSDAVSALNYVTQFRQDFINQKPYAPDVRLTNNSWEIRPSQSSSTQSLTAAIAANAASGMLLVAAAGNGVGEVPQNLDTDPNASLPAASPAANILSVAAVDATDRLLVNSNFGATTVDLAAPGLDILSTEPGGGYGTRTGTSMATPFVSGAAMLFWARYPEATATEVRQAILNGVDVIPDLAGKVATGGRLNIQETLNFDTVAPRAVLTSVPNIIAKGGTFQDITVTYSDNVALKASTFDAADITVTRADGGTFNTTVSLLGPPPTSNGSPIGVTYRITAPNGTWTNADNGTYEIRWVAGQVADPVNNQNSATLLGSFQINIPAPDDFRVTSTVDSVDQTPADGRVEDSQLRATLRAAVQEANAEPDANTIKLAAGTYTLALAGANEDNAATGDLDIRQTVTISGAGAGLTVIDAAALDRVFHVQPGITLMLQNLTIRGGRAADGRGGGGILNEGFLTLDHVEITGNTATSSGGGGVLNDVTTTSTNDTLTILDSTLSNNTATAADGGGLKNVKGKASIQRSTFNNNTAGTSGGGVSIQANTVVVTNSTFSSNTAGTIGGGLHLNAGVLTLTNATITLNTADTAGGGLVRTSGTARLINTIVAGNLLNQTGPDIDINGTTSASGSGNNLIGIVGNSTASFSTTRGDIFGTAASPQNANLAMLANYGGPTLTHRPNVGSPVIDMGSPVADLTVDQRGLARTNDGDNNTTAISDIGAVEFVLFGSIAGVAFHDLDQDGQRDADERGLSGWTIFLDTNNNGVLNAGERSTVTGTNGSYVFNSVAPGSYVIAEVRQTGWVQTLPDPASPTNGRRTLSLAPGEDFSGGNFGNFGLPGEIRGTVFLDADGDTVRDTGEVAYPGLTVFLDTNGNRQLDSSEQSTVTDSDGLYSFPELAPLVDHRVTLRLPVATGLTGPSVLNANSLDGTRGFQLVSAASGGMPVSNAGDLNGDGIADLVVGQPAANRAYVVFGDARVFDPTLDLSALNGGNGFQINGVSPGDSAGTAAGAAIGDINGDGLDDLLIGAESADRNGGTNNGEAYVIFGRRSEFPQTLELSSLDGQQGFVLKAASNANVMGRYLAGLGDFNGDGFDDFAVADYSGRRSVVFGRGTAFPASLDLSSLDGTTGFRIEGDAGGPVANAGDVNNDGLPDLVIGSKRDGSGNGYVVFGRRGTFGSVLQLASLNGANGFKVDRPRQGLLFVSGAGDVNGDGLDDLVFGSPYAGVSFNDPGRAYVLFGRTSPFPASVALSAVNGTDGFRVDGVGTGGLGISVSRAGDFNADGLDDFMLGAYLNGISYVVFGSSDGFPASFSISEVGAGRGLQINGFGTFFGVSGSGIGDFNADGGDDVLIGTGEGRAFVVFGQPGFSTAFPSVRLALVRLNGDEVRDVVNVGLKPQTGSIRGQLFDDRNRNGVRDAGEAAIASGNVFLDTNSNDRRDVAEPVAVTDGDGKYEFSGLDAFTGVAQPNRTFRVVEEVNVERLELVQSAPSKVQGNVGVTLFAADAKLRTGVDITSDGLGGFLLTGTDGVGTGFNAQELFSVSANGRSVNIFAAADHPQGIASDGTYAYWADLNADSDQTRVFRQALAGGAKELVYASLGRETGESATGEIVAATGLDFVPGAAGALITVDALQGQLSRVLAQPDVTAGDVTAIGAAQSAGFLDQAHAQFIDEENGVVYVADPGFVAAGDDRSRDLPARILSIPLAGGSFTTLFAGDLPSFLFFGAEVPASRPRGIAVHDGTIYVSGDRAIYSLPIGGGTPTVVASDERFAHLAGLTFSGDSLFVIDNGTPTSTNATVWQVTLQAQPSRTVHVDQTSDTRSWEILLLPGQTVSDVDFARFDPNTAVGASGTQSIRGFVFHDLNGNGVEDANEAGIVGVTVFLDLNRNGSLDSGDLTTITLAGDDPNTTTRVETAGEYAFTGREPGLFEVLIADTALEAALTTARRVALTPTDLPASATNSTGTPRAATTGDFNKDDLNDVIVADSENGQVTLFQNTGDQRFVLTSTLDVRGLPNSVLLLNMDGDSRPDLAIGRQQFGHVSLWKNLPGGQFEERSNAQKLLLRSPGLEDFGVPSTVISADFNNDGRADLAVVDANPAYDRVFVFLRTAGDFSFAAPQILSAPGLPKGLVAADLNGDGRADLATTVPETDQLVVWLNLNNGTGRFNTTTLTTAVGDGPSALAALDVNGDDKLDLAVANTTAGTISVLSNNGMAQFTSLTTLALTAPPTGLLSANFDRQNGPDLAVTLGDGNNSAQPLVVIYHTGSNSNPYDQAVAYGATIFDFSGVATATGLAIASSDFDRDADPDLVVVNSATKTVSVLRNSPARGGQSVRLATSGVATSATDINFGINSRHTTSFNATTGELTITLLAAADVELDALGTQVQLRVQGVVDESLNVAAHDVVAIVVQGSSGADRVDLSRVTAAAGFDHAGGITTTLNGNDGNDTITGTGFSDQIIGGAGNDLLDGGVGNDSLFGSADDDSLFGGDGDDSLDGEAGINRLNGGSGTNTLLGGTVTNAPPSFVIDANQVVPEDAGEQTVANWAMSISAGPNETEQTVEFIVSNDNPSQYVVQPSIAPDGTLSYTPAPNFHGVATITVQIHDNGGTDFDGIDTSVAQTFTITVNAVNDAPLANAQSATTAEDTAKELMLTGSDGDSEVNQSLTFEIVMRPAHGTVSDPDPATRQVIYSPDENYHGPDSFTFRVTDDSTAGGAALNSDAATVSLTVESRNDAPVARNDSYPVMEDIALNVSAALGVLSNDTNVDGDSLMVELVTDVAHGTLSLNSDGSFTYTPATNGNNSDSFTYRIFDGQVNSAAATVSLASTAVNDPPEGTPQSMTTAEDVAKAIQLAGIDGDPEVNQTLTFAIVTQPTHGDLSGFDAATGAVIYTPNPEFNGMDSFTFTATDDSTAGGPAKTSAPATVTITVNAVNDTPSANAQSATTAEDTAKELTLTGSDGDSEVNQSLTFVIVTRPAHGTVSDPDPATQQVIYTPDENYHGPDSFTFRVIDDTTAGGAALNSAPATVLLSVSHVNDRPAANAQQVTTDEDLAVSMTLTGTDNDSDVVQTLTYSLVATPSHGSLSEFNSSTGAVIYTPNAGYFGSDSFTFTVTDDTLAGGAALTSTAATVDLTVRELLDLRYEVTLATNTTRLVADTLNGRLRVTINNGPDLHAGIDTHFVRSLTIGGGAGIDTLNLSGLASSLYPRLRQIVLVGGAGNDVITGSDLVGIDERISGGAGNDVLKGGSGTDRLVETQTGTAALNVLLTIANGKQTLAGFGTDTIESIEEMSLTGSTGADKIIVDRYVGNVTLIGGSGKDTLGGGSGNDNLDGGDGDDSLTGNGGNDQFIGGAGIDVVTESDLASANASNFVLTPTTLNGLGADTLNSIELVKLTTSNISSRIDASAFAGGTILTGGNGNDALIGGSGSDAITGGKGDDAITGGLGKDTLIGGNDAGTKDTLIELVSGNITLTGTTLTTVLLASTVVDTISGFDAASLTGGNGDDTLSASAFTFAVTLLGGGGNDSLVGGIGSDNLDGQSGNDTLTGGLGNDLLNGGADGIDRLVEVSKATAATTFTLTDSSLSGFGADVLANIDQANLTGGSANDTLTAAGFQGGSVTLLGGGGKDTLIGTTFNDFLSGQAGDDSLVGGAGNDLLTGEAGNDRFDGGADRDRILEAGFNFTITSAQLTGNGTDALLNASIEEAALTGTTAANVLTASAFAGAVTLNGLAGDDKLFGGNGSDSLDGGTGKDSLVGGLGNDLLNGGTGNDTLFGGGGADNLDGGADNDILDGQADDDLINGGIGRDLLIGGLGADALAGGDGDDIILGGTTTHSATIAALNAIMAEWTSAKLYATRVTNLQNNSIKLNASMIQNDASAIDSLSGNADQDVFFWSNPDQVLDAVLNETRVEI